jgi:hypothetical protein
MRPASKKDSDETGEAVEAACHDLSRAAQALV